MKQFTKTPFFEKEDGVFVFEVDEEGRVNRNREQRGRF